LDARAWQRLADPKNTAGHISIKPRREAARLTIAAARARATNISHARTMRRSAQHPEFGAGIAHGDACEFSVATLFVKYDEVNFYVVNRLYRIELRKNAVCTQRHLQFKSCCA
jgi:hypothetical protein